MTSTAPLSHRLYILLLRVLPFMHTGNRRNDKMLLCLFALACLFWFSSLLLVLGVVFHGDEVFYSRASKILGNVMAGREPYSDAVVEYLVGFGWFMPGVPLFLSPLYVIFEDPSLVFIRTVSSLVVAGLWIWTLREAHTQLGQRYAIMLLVFPTLCFTWQLFGKTIWADLAAGLLLIIAIGRLSEISSKVLNNEKLSLWAIFQFEIIVLLMVYMRGSTYLFVLAAHIFLLALMLIRFDFRNLAVRVLPVFIGALLFVALLLPWSLTATKQLGAPVFTTSTTSLSFAISFGNKDKVCFGICEGRNQWVSAANFSRRIARERGVSELTVQREMMAFTTSGLTLDGYVRLVARNFDRFLTQPAAFLNIFIGANHWIPDDLKGGIQSIFNGMTLVLYWPFLVALLSANMWVVRQQGHGQVLSLIIKMSTLCFFLQPFVHITHGRYWVAFAPLMAVAMAFLFSRFASPTKRQHNEALPHNFLFPIQVLYALGFASVLAIIVVY